MKWDLEPYKSAIAQLDETLKQYSLHASSSLAVFLRAASIQAFEFTYELSWRLLKRYLQATTSDAVAVDHMSFGQIIRTGCEQGLLRSEVAAWRKYRDNRNLTSHTYNAVTAETVFAQIPAFLLDAQFLLRQLESRLKDDL